MKELQEHFYFRSGFPAKVTLKARQAIVKEVKNNKRPHEAHQDSGHTSVKKS